MAVVLVDEMISLLRDVANKEDLKVTVNQSLRAGAIVATVTICGGVAMGPIAFLLSPPLAGLLAYLTCKDFKSVGEIISDMPPDKQQELANQFKKLMVRHGVTTVTALAALVAGGEAVRKEVVTELAEFVRREMQLSLT